MKEEWRSLKEFKCGKYYEVSNLGRVRSKDRWTKGKNGSNRLVKGKILKYKKCVNGYCEVMLYENGKSEVYLVHRLVAIIFIPNPSQLPQVNHLDENKENNAFFNLEWSTPLTNSQYSNNKTVIAYKAKTNEFVGVFESIKQASEILGAYRSNISEVLNGKRKTAKGYYFEWAD